MFDIKTTKCQQRKKDPGSDVQIGLFDVVIGMNATCSPVFLSNTSLSLLCIVLFSLCVVVITRVDRNGKNATFDQSVFREAVVFLPGQWSPIKAVFFQLFVRVRL